jgi:peptidoglycan/xylan/chitin deacetylase (PgdA/CDA1 family)
LRFLKTSTNVIGLDDYAAGRLVCGPPNVVITFDDGYKSWVETAVPALIKLGLPATFFISSGFVGLSSEAQAEFIRCRLQTCQKTTGGLDHRDLRWMAEEGFTVGGHTRSHANLTEMADPEQVLREIVEDKQQLESLIGREVRYFAYPFGACQHPTLDLVALAKKAGYRCAVTTQSGLNWPGENDYLLRRELVSPAMAKMVFKARVYGNSDGVRLLKSPGSLLLQKRSPSVVHGQP